MILTKFSQGSLRDDRDQPRSQRPCLQKDMTDYESASIEEIYEWMSGIDDNYFEDQDEMLGYFDIFVSSAGLLLWRAIEDGHPHFQKRTDDKVTVTVIDTGGERMESFNNWCAIDYDWFDGKMYLSKTPTFDSMDFRDDLKGFIQ